MGGALLSNLQTSSCLQVKMFVCSFLSTFLFEGDFDGYIVEDVSYCLPGEVEKLPSFQSPYLIMLYHCHNLLKCFLLCDPA